MPFDHCSVCGLPQSSSNRQSAQPQPHSTFSFSSQSPAEGRIQRNSHMSDSRSTSTAPRRSARFKRAREEEEEEKKQGESSSSSSSTKAAAESSSSCEVTRPAKQHKATVSELSLSPAQRCCDDMLTLIFAFFDLKQLVPIARSCRAWLAAADRMPLRSLTFDLASEDLQSLSISR